MIAIDTNVIVRFLTRDDRSQARIAATLIEKSRVWISKSVLLETEWVLRYTYEYEAAAINDALTALAGLNEVVLEDPSAVRHALAWHAGGMDFADALHLASVGPTTQFATFDRKLARRASVLPGAPGVDLQGARRAP